MRLLLFTLLISSTMAMQAKPPRLLFVGNGLTYTNNLPELVKLEFKNRDIKVKTKMLANLNYELKDHWEKGELQKLIKSGKFDYVIIQQGPSSQGKERQTLLHCGNLISRLCKQSNTKLVYLMVWPSRSYYHTFDEVIASHKDAAEMSNAELCPVGEVWKKHFDETGDFGYYGNDGYYPSIRGSQIAASVIADHLSEMAIH